MGRVCVHDGIIPKENPLFEARNEEKDFFSVFFPRRFLRDTPNESYTLSFLSPFAPSDLGGVNVTRTQPRISESCPFFCSLKKLMNCFAQKKKKRKNHTKDER